VFEECFIAWMRSVCGTFEGLQVAIDGKTARRSASAGGIAVGLIGLQAAANQAEQNAKAQQALNQQISTETQRAKDLEQRRLADAEQARKEAEYDQWFAALPRGKQVETISKNEQAEREQAEAQHQMTQAALGFLSILVCPNVYEIR
jgi:hypothetical protein